MKDLLRICLGFMAIASCSYSIASADRIKDMLYVPVDAAAACFRRHNGTHQFGCSSSRSGSVGVIHYIESDIDIEWLEKNGTAGPYTIVLSFDMFTQSNLRRFKKSNNVNGVLLTRNTSLERPDRYSPDDTCPNRYSGSTTCDHQWNPYGSSLLIEDWPFPMFYTQDEEALAKIKACYSKYNAHDREKQAERSLCAIEMKSFMFAAVDAETCIRRSNSGWNFNPNTFCDPIGDRNIHWPAGPMSNNVKSVIMVIARLDSNSLFENLIPGAGSAATGLVTLLAAATYLHHLNVTVKDTNIVFSLLNGESMDYIGSSRLVHDLLLEKFDSLGGHILRLDQITSIIELGQLGEGDIYLHTNNTKNNPILVNLQNLQKGLNATFMDNSVPPASVQSFLKRDSSLPVVVIANHGQNFTNKYYNGLLDDAESLGYSSNYSERLTASLAKVAAKLGEELYRVATNGQTPSSNYTFVEELVGELLPCYLDSARCPLFRAASPIGTKLPNQVFPMYTSVVKNDMAWTTLTGQLLALLTGEHFPQFNTSVACQEQHLLWMAGYNFSGTCINATANFSLAVSPAFDNDAYNMTSGFYPTWTESVWQELSMRMLLKAPHAQERLSLIIGSIVAILSFILVWFVKSRSHVLFNSGLFTDLWTYRNTRWYLWQPVQNYTMRANYSHDDDNDDQLVSASYYRSVDENTPLLT